MAILGNMGICKKSKHHGAAGKPQKNMGDDTMIVPEEASVAVLAAVSLVNWKVLEGLRPRSKGHCCKTGWVRP